MKTIARNAGLAGLLGLTLFVGSARAEVVVYDNRDGAFQWTRTFKLPGEEPKHGAYLDIRLPPTQSGERLPGTIGNWFEWGPTGSTPGVLSLLCTPETRVSRSVDFKDYIWNGQNFSTTPIREYSFGEFIQEGDNWQGKGWHYFALPFTFSMAGGTPLIASPAYLGVRIADGFGNFNYGWILYEDYTNPIMWAWETELNTPIQIPVPAPSGIAFAGCVGVLTARRSRSSS